AAKLGGDIVFRLPAVEGDEAFEVEACDLRFELLLQDAAAVEVEANVPAAISEDRNGVEENVPTFRVVEVANSDQTAWATRERRAVRMETVGVDHVRHDAELGVGADRADAVAQSLAHRHDHVRVLERKAGDALHR